MVWGAESVGLVRTGSFLADCPRLTEYIPGNVVEKAGPT